MKNIYFTTLFLYFLYHKYGKKLFKSEIINLSATQIVFYICDIEKLKTMLLNKCSCYSVKISFLSYNYSLSGSILRKIVFAMLYICKTETTHAGIRSS